MGHLFLPTMRLVKGNFSTFYFMLDTFPAFLQAVVANYIFRTLYSFSMAVHFSVSWTGLMVSITGTVLKCNWDSPLLKWELLPRSEMNCGAEDVCSVWLKCQFWVCNVWVITPEKPPSSLLTTDHFKYSTQWLNILKCGVYLYIILYYSKSKTALAESTLLYPNKTKYVCVCRVLKCFYSWK